MREIYNEGRVQGYSTYDIYVRQLLAEFPECPVPTEKEWLSSTLSHGSTLILKIPAKTRAGYHDYELPEGSRLSAATSLLATVFEGECNTDINDIWATSITSYGPLTSNTRKLHPVTPGDSNETFPVMTTIDYESTAAIMNQYVKIVDGVVYQPGTWELPEGKASGAVDAQGNPVYAYPDRHPFMDFKPDLTKRPILRIRFSASTSCDFYLMISGFVDKVAIRPLFNTETGVISNTDYANGGYMGPLSYPWANPITFVATNTMVNLYNIPSFNRYIQSETAETIMNAQAAIDMSSTNPLTYYADNDKEDAGIKLNATYVAPKGDYISDLTVYQRNDIKSGTISGRTFPPVLYAAKIGFAGDDQKLVPLDTAAPGTVKILEDVNEALAYPKVLPYVYAIYRDNQGNLFFIDKDTTSTNMIAMNSKVTLANIGTAAAPVYEATIQSGSTSVKALSLRDASGNLLNTLYLNKPLTVPSLKLNKDNYITMNNGLRLYVSNTAPTDSNIPVGSIGIGW